MPPHWLDTSGLHRALRKLGRYDSGGHLSGYGNPLGFQALREDICRRLAEFGIDAAADQVLLTTGVSGAVDLIARHLLRRDDVVLVDDPGYSNTFCHMRALGVEMLGVPWTDTGPDLDVLEELALTYQPRVFITSSIVHNPTGSSISQATAFRLLQIAEHYNFYVVEDDVDGPCHPNPPSRLSSMDQLNRVIYVNGFSKALSPRLRVGFLAARRDLAGELADLKMVTQSASSEIAEKLVHEVIVSGHYRKHRTKLISLLQHARDRSLPRLRAMGLTPVHEDTHGLFAWMNVPDIPDTTALAKTAAKRHMLLAPGSMFSPDLRTSGNMRFNVAYCQDNGTIRLLETLLNEHARQPA